ncbi:MAG: hypothetical protein D6809_00575 [Gammaproteobacteria bacterium]|nr:MAG: hypothetical protein D6809_00575 [Gammaproteobacteria bacterium]
MEQSIQEALEAYRQGDLSGAVSSLQYAEQLIQQEKAKRLAAALPEPLPGWQAERAEGQSAPAAVLGGGVGAKRRYRRGEAEVRIEILSDSPVLQSVLMMLSNPLFATADGGRLVRVGRLKGVLRYDPEERSGSLQLVVAHRFLVNVEGEAVDRDTLLAYAKAIDLQALARLP